MYNPNPFKIDDLSTITEFVQKNSFASIISSTHSYPLVSHTPLLIEKSESGFILKGHLAKANKHTQLFETPSKVVTVFQGAHGYISSFAKDPDAQSILPTWDYEIVHAHGVLEVMSDDELKDFMHTLTNTFEADQPIPIKLAEYSTKELNDKLKQIVGFTIKVEEWHGCFRLNQNRNTKTRTHIKAHISNNEDLVKAIDRANPSLRNS